MVFLYFFYIRILTTTPPRPYPKWPPELAPVVLPLVLPWCSRGAPVGPRGAPVLLLLVLPWAPVVLPLVSP